MKAPAIHIGDVFEIPLGNCKRHMQFVVVDSTCLGGWGIRVFKKEYSMVSTPSVDEIVANEIDFYCLTYAIGQGVLDGLWKRVGKSKDIGDLSKMVFRDYHQGILPGEKNRWWVWTACKEVKKYKVLPKRYLDLPPGILITPSHVIDRIRTGRWYPFPNVYDDYKGTTWINRLLGIERIPDGTPGIPRIIKEASDGEES